MGIYYKKTEQIGKISKEENVRWEFIIRRLSKFGKYQRKRTYICTMEIYYKKTEQIGKMSKEENLLVGKL